MRVSSIGATEPNQKQNSFKDLGLICLLMSTWDEVVEDGI